MKKKKNVRFGLLIICILIVFLTGFLGSQFTGDGVDSDWYKEVRPSITPPNWTFGVVWPILYLLIAVSLYIAWKSCEDNGDRKNVAIAYGVNLIANGFWSYLYFGIENPVLAFYDIILVWISIIGMIIVSGYLNKKAAWLLVPYLLWVSFAFVLNLMSI